MKNVMQIRESLFSWRAIADMKIDEFWTDEEKAEVEDLRRHARHHVEALEWVLSDG